MFSGWYSTDFYRGEKMRKGLGGGQFKAGLSYRYVRPYLKKRRRGIERGRRRDEKSPLLAPDSEAV